MPVPAPASAVADTEWLVRTDRPANPAEVTSTASVRPYPASRALGVGDAVHRERGFLGGGGAGDQRLGGGFGGVFQVERDVLRRRGSVGQPGERVLRHHAGHGDGAFGQFGEAGRIDRAGRHDGGLLAQEDAQAEVLAFGTLDMLGLAQAAGDGQRGAGDQHRVGGIGAGGAGAGDQVGEKVEFVGHAGLPVVVVDHACRTRSV